MPRVEAETRQLLLLPETYVRPAAENLRDAALSLARASTADLPEIAGDLTRTLGERLAAGFRAALEGWRPHPVLSPTMLHVAGGIATLGTDLNAVAEIAARYANVGVEYDWILKEVPLHSVAVPTYAIGKYLVTCAEYAAFCAATDHAPLPSTWNVAGRFHPADANTPVHGVSLESAQDYCRWLSIETGRAFHLPSEAQWEYAASGPERREFPWGGAFDPDCANTLEVNLRMAAPVGIFPAGASWIGALDMAGNVEEWTSSRVSNGYPGGVHVEDDLRKTLGPDYPVCRGGSFTRYADLARCRRRHGPFPSVLYPVGLRLAESLKNDQRPERNYDQ